MESGAFNNRGAIGTGSFQMMGILNSFKTGDIFIDMVLAMCIPIILNVIFAWGRRLEKRLDFQRLFRLLFGNESVKKDYERFITQTTQLDSQGRLLNLMAHTKNNALITAINLYLDQIVKLELDTAYMDLAETQRKTTIVGTTMYAVLKGYDITNRTPPGRWHTLGKFGDINNSGTVLLKIDVASEGDSDGRHGRDDNRQNTGSTGLGARAKTTTYHFKSKKKDACDAFITTAFQWYMEELRIREPRNARWFYEMKAREFSFGGSNGENANSNPLLYKRFMLSGEKTFSTLFFPEKENLLSLINHFSNKTGKYSIPGYPSKVGILLHGPPGTGKTSLIKALAQYTKRSIVNVPLTQINTNSELMSIVYDRQFRLDRSNFLINLGFDDVIFVMEDVDAASDVVRRRDGKSSHGAFDSQESFNFLPVPKSMFRMLMESPHTVCQSLVSDLTKKSERLREAADLERPEVLRAITRRVASIPGLGLVTEIEKDATMTKICNQAIKSSDHLSSQCSKLDKILVDHAKQLKEMINAGAELDDSVVDELLGKMTSLSGILSAGCPSSVSTADVTDPFDVLALHRMTTGLGAGDNSKTGEKDNLASASFWRPDLDKLSLAGLLNVLDGVVDSPGRIVIMTTNHPEKLDPALVRPGRIDKKIFLGHMIARDIVSMIEHFFQTQLSPSQGSRVEIAVLDGLELTPAQVEQLAAEHEDIDSMVAVLEEKAKPRLQFQTRG